MNALLGSVVLLIFCLLRTDLVQTCHAFSYIISQIHSPFQNKIYKPFTPSKRKYTICFSFLLQTFRQILEECFQLCVQSKLSSISLPMLGCGRMLQYPLQTTANIMMDVTSKIINAGGLKVHSTADQFSR